jgi:low affinity Fe/Cu permease
MKDQSSLADAKQEVVQQRRHINGASTGLRHHFQKFAQTASAVVGSHWAFLLALLVIIVWAATGPMFRYSDTWQLVINTGTTIVTFLMVFLLQNAQIRDAKALNIKLDELLRAIEGARTGLVNLEGLSDEELDRLLQELQRLGKSEGVRPVEKGPDSPGAADRQSGRSASGDHPLKAD